MVTLIVTAAFASMFAPFLGRGSSPAVGTEALARMDRCQLDAVFALGTVGSPPCGAGRGRVLLVTDSRMPRLRARLKGCVWRGKYFYPRGCTFTNQWLGFKAVEAPVAVGPSWADRAPCLVLDYPTTAAVFGNTRDELREVGEGVFLGRFYDRCPCPKLKGYFVLDFGRKCQCR